MPSPSLTAVFIYPAKQAPHYKIGYKAALGFCLGSMAFTAVFKVLAEREKRKARAIEALQRAGDDQRGDAEMEDIEEK